MLLYLGKTKKNKKVPLKTNLSQNSYEKFYLSNTYRMIIKNDNYLSYLPFISKLHEVGSVIKFVFSGGIRTLRRFNLFKAVPLLHFYPKAL